MIIFAPRLGGTAEDSEWRGRVRIRPRYVTVDSMSEKPKSPEIEMRPDGWDRFVKAVHAAAKHGPVHRAAKPKRRRKANLKPKKSG